MNRLAKVDLNLLPALHALLSERSVTRAGRRLGLSQPAMSAALSRLRELLHDPILVRTPRGMIPTDRALDLLAPVESLLGQVERMLEPVAYFDPSQSTRTFSLGGSDLAAFLLLPPLLERLRVEAPLVNLQMLPLARDQLWRSLESGRVDLVLAVPGVVEPGIFQRGLFQDSFVCVVRKNHPSIQKHLDLDLFVATPQLLISPLGERTSTVDKGLAQRGLTRRIAVQLPNFLLAPHVVAHSDLLLTVPSRIARQFQKLTPLRIFEPPLEIPPFSVAQFWHERVHADPVHRWFREHVFSTAHAL